MFLVFRFFTISAQQPPFFNLSEVEMKDMEIQTDVEDNSKKEDDLIRLQSSMSMMQEDHLKGCPKRSYAHNILISEFCTLVLFWGLLGIFPSYSIGSMLLCCG